MLPAFIDSAMLRNAFLAAFRRLPEKTAVILRGSFVFFRREAISAPLCYK